MTTGPQLANGAILLVGATSPGAIQVNGLTSVSFSGYKNNIMDITSITDTTKKFLPGLADPGSLSIDGYGMTEDTGQSLLTTNALSKVLTYFTLTNTDASTVVGSGYVESVEYDEKSDSPHAAKWSIKITGVPTVT